ncbi:mitochondrial sodium/calcium exchanger protein isoform X2 [Drosophila obscura]|uniref:mitochondrial sodium/calcium exchanger protein isoform X2 n=1 Tax=Drosophila obscura TaxID=7282 RepID=UPI001BB29C57|nr:mitochondrial sodium/calcium exchanger protein isoform X2 [Drosophila obscura]
MFNGIWTRNLHQGDACNKVNHLPEPQRCQFVRETADCRDNMYLINYLTWHYCNVDSRNKFNAFWSMLAMTVVATYIFWMMQKSVRAYFCPTLKVLADTFSMNENLAGVTLLTIANGSSDLFTAVAGLLVFSKWGFLMSMTQTLFQHTFVAGLVMLTRPFYVEPSYFLRDFGFLFLNTTFMDFIHKRESGITKLGAVPGAFIYLAHVMVAIMDQSLLQARVYQLQKTEGSEPQAEQLEELMRQTDLGVNREKLTRSAARRRGGANRHLLQQFWESIFKFDKEQFRRGSIGVRIYLLIKEPMEMLLRLLVPVVDVEKPNHGWSKLLCCLQFIIAPTYIFFILLKDVNLLGTAVYIVAFYIMLPLGCLIFWRTRTDTTPKFFRVDEGSFGETACIFAEVSLVFSLVAALTTNFQMRRACGLLLVAYYLFFVAVLLLLETDVIHAYGVDD